jgi:pheromone shutdown-related protein TraB
LLLSDTEVCLNNFLFYIPTLLKVKAHEIDMKYRTLTLIGTSHVSKDSVLEVKKTIETEKPGIVAIELDRDRLQALLHKQKRGLFIKGVGLKGMLFAAIGAWVERKIGKIVKVEPGSEMKMAVQMAKKVNAKLALIDQHITITLRRFSETLTWKEKFRFIADLFIGIFAPNKYLKEFNIRPSELSKVPSKETIKKILKFFEKRYPNVYNVLVHERNVYMARNLAHLIKHNPKETIVAVVGAGHEKEMISLIKQNLNKADS